MTGSKLYSRDGLKRRTVLGGLGAASLAWLPNTAWSADKTLTIAIPNNPATLDPMNQTNHDAMAATQVVFENLMEVDADGNLRPQLALEAPKVSDDRQTYWFDLRDDVYFQGGQKFTAEDVKYSYEYVLDPANKAVRRGLWAPIREITVESPTRVRFELSKPYRPWLDYMTKFMGIFPKGSREKFGDDHFRLHPTEVGTGPGMFVEWRQNDAVEFRRNPNYWQKGLPHWDRLVIRTVPEDSVRVAYLMTGEAQIISAPPPKEFVHLRDFPGITGELKSGWGCMLTMEINNMRAPFDDVNFRKAMACAIDRDLIAKNVFYGTVEPSAVPAPTSSWWYDKEAGDMLRFDLDKARSFLAKSKYPDGAEFSLMVPAQPYLVDVRDAALVVQSQLAVLNIKANLEFVEAVQTISRTISGTHQAAFWPNMGPPTDPTFEIQVLYTPDQVGSKSSGYTNQALTDALNESFRYDDQEHLAPIFRKMQKILAEDSPHIWLGFVDVANLWRKDITGFKVNTGLTMTVRDVDLP